MKRLLSAALMAMVLLVISSCSGSKISLVGKKCPDAEIDYINAFKFDGITYSELYDSDLSKVERGERIGEIGYMLSGHACSDYQMQDGDATLLDIGTELYKVKGYKQQFRIWAGNKLFQVSNNPSASTIKELYDIDGRIASVRFESGIDGSPMNAFTSNAVALFAEEYMKLKIEDETALRKQTKNLSGDSYFMRITLDDGTSFRILYWLKHNVISPGAYATAQLNEVVNMQRQLNYVE
ncbi:hypothetical protein K0T92_17890 [Paenibacillus oenotherae]|uniref:Lipoprotein n=1 Tax=Paenibacillus oenotherae TaxID=1435645 RepID=A0ABS7DA15_9BACL|nr:hypothetical protein [Paenibacillus oenotherae]MBW7476593.1 hypothetical protein [Paenibacillus oenotherae]